MNILVTGATGFVGSHFVKQALDENHTVYALKRRPTSIPRIHLKCQPIWVECQLDQVPEHVLNLCDVVVHFAAHTANPPYDLLANCTYWNLIAVLNLFEKCRKAGISHFICAGSCFEYGKTGETLSSIPADSVLEPTNSYAASKACASICLCQWAEEFSVSLEILRIFHVYGEGEKNTRLYPSLIHAAKSGLDYPMTYGEQIRDFQPVNLVANAFLQRSSSILQEPSHVSVRNLSTCNPMSILDFAMQTWNDFDTRGILLPGRIPYRRNENMKLIPGDPFIHLH